jgi:hypothetical protein
MPFFEPDRSPEFKIDYSNRQPVSVMVVFNTTGDFKPVYFGLTDLYGNTCKVKIINIKYSKDIRGNGKSFCCIYLSGDQQKECVLTYYVSDRIWVLGN